MKPNVVILAAGMGSRLGRSLPKPLTKLADGRTIVRQQMDKLDEAFGVGHYDLHIVVGYKREHVMEAVPTATFVHNERFKETNTSKSLKQAFDEVGEGGVLWLNGDVVFDAEILKRARQHLEADQSFVTVNTAAVGEEEVKYTTDAEGWILELSKVVKDGLGEAVGINFISSKDRTSLRARLEEVADQDYFERGIELGIEQDGLKVVPMDVSDLYAVEVDFVEDLSRANQFV